MIKDTFKLKENIEFIELIKLLKVMELSQSGGHAKLIVEDELIKVNGEVELRKRRKLRKGDIVVFENTTITIK